jgi:hypothetical protein
MNTIRIGDRDQLYDEILRHIQSYGTSCDFNHLDVSQVEDMSQLFEGMDFQGDISKWDVSNVTHMNYMFHKSSFNGDISQWNVRHVRNMNYLFKDAQFDGDLSQWNIHPDCSTRMVFSKFHCSPLGIMSLLQGQVHLDKKPKGWKSWISACKSMDLSLHDTAQFIYQQWKHPISAPKMPEMPTDLFGPN